MNSDAQVVLQSWSAPVAVDASLCLAALFYARGWKRLRIAANPQFPVWRLAAFFAGIVTVWIAIGSPLQALDDVSLTVHMVQHLLLSAVAPPLLLLGAPELPLLRGIPQSLARGVVSPFLRLPFTRRFGRLVSNPSICWLVLTLALIGWHIPAVFELALRWDWLHKLEHASFLGAGLLFWWPVVQPWPSTPRWPEWTIPLYLFSATLPCDALSGFLTFCDRVIYPSYISAPRVFGLSPLEDQECAAALMWVAVTLILLIPAVLVTLKILSPSKLDLPDDPTAEQQRFLRGSLHDSNWKWADMATEPTISVLNGACEAQETRTATFFSTVSDYWALTKPEVNFLILITTFAGFYLASTSGPVSFHSLLAFHTVLGTLLVAGGTATLNQASECSFDRQMRRTARRPVAAGRIQRSHAFVFGVLLALAGAAYLRVEVNGLACLLAIITLATYLFLYTPLKRVTPLCILVGAFPGAMPPLIGWAAARGRLDPQVWMLYAIVFLWQFPHFMAIAWMYREDYARAGYLVLPLNEQRDRYVIWQSFVASLVLLAISLVPAIYEKSSLIYFAAALTIGTIFSYYSARLALRKSNASARQLLVASILYLPAIFVLMMLDRKWL